MMQIAAHSNSINDDLAITLTVLNDMGISCIDLRNIWGRNIVDLTDTEIKKCLSLIKSHDIRVACISPWLFFKLPLKESPTETTVVGSYADHIAKLEKAVELAKIFDVNIIRCFTFANEIRFKIGPTETASLPGVIPDVWGKIIDRIKKAIEIAEKAEITLAIENCHHANAGTGILVGRLIDEIGSPYIKMIWDPINSYYSSGTDPFPYEYAKINHYVNYIDIKDAIIDKRINNYSFCQFGEGNSLCWPPILKALHDDKFNGVLSLETVGTPNKGTKEEFTREFYRRLKNVLNVIESKSEKNGQH